MSNYIDKSKKINDVKSTGYTFTLVGLLGGVLVVLLNFDILPFKLVSSQKLMFSIVMGIVFLVFIIIGIRSFLSLKKLKIEANSQIKEEKNIYTTIIDNYSIEIKAISGTDDNDLYFVRNAKIEYLLKKEFPLLSESDLEHYADELYDKIFCE